ATVLSRLLEHNFRTYLPYDLMVKSDRCSMAHALEARAPFLDTALVEYAATLPPGYLRRGADTKRILKHAFADLFARQDGLRRAARRLVPPGSARLPRRSSRRRRAAVAMARSRGGEPPRRRAPAWRARSRAEAVGSAHARDLAAQPRRRGARRRRRMSAVAA